MIQNFTWYKSTSTTTLHRVFLRNSHKGWNFTENSFLFPMYNGYHIDLVCHYVKQNFGQEAPINITDLPPEYIKTANVQEQEIKRISLNYKIVAR